MEAVDVRGRFVWHELLTRDVPGAKSFYSKLIGWKALPWPLSPSYTICHADVGPVAGIMQMPDEVPADAPAHWMQYIGTRDVDATADAAVRAGGSVMKPPTDMQGAGRFAVLKDPLGALFAIIDPENAQPESASPPPGTFSWHELATTDYEAAFAFYSQLFGWDALERMDMGPAGVYLIFGWKGMQRGGMYIKPADWQAPPNWLPYALVGSADESFALALSSGASQLIAPMEVPGGSRIATFSDPTGAAFAVHSQPAATSEPAPQPKPKAKAKAKKKTTRKPAAKKQAARKTTKKSVKKPAKKPARKVARKAVKKAARKPARKKSKATRRKK